MRRSSGGSSRCGPLGGAPGGDCKKDDGHRPQQAGGYHAAHRMGRHEDPTSRALLRAILKRLPREYGKLGKQAKGLTCDAGRGAGGARVLRVHQGKGAALFQEYDGYNQGVGQAPQEPGRVATPCRAASCLAGLGVELFTVRPVHV